MNRYTRNLVASALALTSVAGTADARSVSAMIGKPQNPADDGCFSEWYATQTNNCAGTRVMHFPLVVDTSENYWVYVNAYGGSSASNVSCQGFGLNKEVTLVWSTPVRGLSSFGASAGIDLGRVFVPDLGTLTVACWLNQGGRVNSISFGL